MSRSIRSAPARPLRHTVLLVAAALLVAPAWALADLRWEELPLPPGARPISSETEGAVVVADTGAVTERAVVGGVPVELEYTTDARLEARLRGVLEDMGVGLAHTILMHPETGEVFAYLSTEPGSFPPTRAYPTASLMKIVTAAAALGRAPETSERSCRFHGSPYHLDLEGLVAPREGGAVHSFRRAMAMSNNQCFARVAVHDVGEAGLFEEMAKVGFFESPAPHHPPGVADGISAALDLGMLGSGLAGSFITPLGATRLAALLVEGELVTPYWIAAVRDTEGRRLALPPRAPPRLVWAPRVASTLREVMADVAVSGTARHAFHDASGEPRLGDIRVSGKTGTLRGNDPAGRYQWFVGVAPIESPRVAIASVVVNTGPGDPSAADVAARSLHGIFCSGGACDVSRADRLYARIRAREAATALAISQHSAALDRAAAHARTYDVVDLDVPPRPLAGSRLEFPRGLRRRPARGEVVLLVTLDATGRVEAAEVASSTLPEFEESVLEQVRAWTFGAPMRSGVPVRARARLPIPIAIQ